ncbi:MAG: polyprenyl synthetase family protein [Myxococcales bacterium]|nr:polyprenyl synthetase family protein [Myxococcales bacterium]
MARRLTRGLERLLDLVPYGLDLADLRELVEDDLVRDEVLAMVAGDDVVGRTNIPRIRPILVALAARATGAKAVDAEAQHAAELLHLALRVHDLALGREGGRRRRVARRLVRSVGWITGNRLTIRALEIARHTEPGVLEELLSALRAFSEAQALSRELVGEIANEDDWKDHADAHTGALFAFCCRAGGHLGGAGPRELAALGRYGRHVGRLWHVAEDVSVLAFGDPALHVVARASTGRPVLPVVVAARQEPSIAERWARLGSDVDPDPEEARALAGELRRLGIPGSREIMAEESWRARRALRVLPDTTYRNGMDRLAAEMVKAGLERAPRKGRVSPALE